MPSQKGSLALQSVDARFSANRPMKSLIPWLHQWKNYQFSNSSENSLQQQRSFAFHQIFVQFEVFSFCQRNTLFCTSLQRPNLQKRDRLERKKSHSLVLILFRNNGAELEAHKCRERGETCAAGARGTDRTRGPGPRTHQR